ncbi:hypothetical protein SYNPS1DRAFT_28406 [Syncephalis pseudoplumigaleata]|uniref:Uncharacterized protein n=1 Tax=Syncephalis pseudoplumigaleata TaxID=1712513 RepID=A0A4P9Z0P5_9FUNG|nr:hypothetical protein SYNPS1DRAFT_28406 [Syncephalis pseudoplumigaleata]|eukprot:RKP25868.1 hypothetical protein SYNPS1DRAFT_28406 [Syncephalis pseudoplumigaleata]
MDIVFAEAFGRWRGRDSLRSGMLAASAVSGASPTPMAAAGRCLAGVLLHPTTLCIEGEGGGACRSFSGAWCTEDKERDDSLQGGHAHRQDQHSTAGARSSARPASPVLSPADGKVCVLEHAAVLVGGVGLVRHIHSLISSRLSGCCQAGNEVLAAQQNERFSRAFRIVLQPYCEDADMDVDETSEPDTSLVAEKTESMLKEYELVEAAALEQRIVEFRNEQNALLEQRLQRAKEEQSWMIRQLAKAGALKQRAMQSSAASDDAAAYDPLADGDAHAYQSSEESDASSPHRHEGEAGSVKPASPSSMLVGSLQQNSLAMLSGLNTTRVERLAQQTPAAIHDTEAPSEERPDAMPSPLFEKIVPSAMPTSMLTRTIVEGTQSTSTQGSNNGNNNNSDSHSNLRKRLLSSQDGGGLNEETIDDGDDGDDNDDLFLLDEEEDVNGANAPQPVVGSLQDSAAYYPRDGDSSSRATSRPGMHFGTSMMMPAHDQFYTASLSQSVSDLSGSVGSGRWKQRSRKKYLPDIDADAERWLDRVAEEDAAAGDDEARDGLSALRQQTNIFSSKGQSPTESSGHMFATSLPINIHRQQAPSNRPRKARVPGGGDDDAAMSALPMPSTATGIAAIRAGSMVNESRATADLHHLANEFDSDIDDDDDEGKEFVAPHLLAARTYTDSNRAIFGSMPRSSRIHSVAI